MEYPDTGYPTTRTGTNTSPDTETSDAGISDLAARPDARQRLVGEANTGFTERTGVYRCPAG